MIEHVRISANRMCARREDRMHAFSGDRTGTRQGVALVVVLWMVVLLATATAMAGKAARTSSRVAANTRAQSTARAMAESGILAATVFIDDSLRALVISKDKRDGFLMSLEPSAVNALPLMQDTLGTGVFAVTVVDVSARLDINHTGIEGLTTLFSTVTTPETARRMAMAVDDLAHETVPDFSAAAVARARRDSVASELLGRDNGPRLLRRIESLDALRDIPGMDVVALERAAPYLTVDGDGQVNRRAAPRAVLASATGSLVDAPSRLMLVARGWYLGHPLTRQIQAVYDVQESGLRLVRWRETDL